jgi:hypothetical protein
MSSISAIISYFSQGVLKPVVTLSSNSSQTVVEPPANNMVDLEEVNFSDELVTNGRAPGL